MSVHDVYGLMITGHGVKGSQKCHGPFHNLRFCAKAPLFVVGNLLSFD